MRSLPPLLKHPEAGMSIVAVLMAAALAGVVAVVSAKMVSNNFNATSSMERRVERVALGRQLMQRVDCVKSLATACTPGAIVSLKDSGGALLVSGTNPPTKIGKFALKATCNTSGGIDVVATRLAAGGTLNSTANTDFVKDSLTGLVQKWDDPNANVLGSGIAMCGASSPWTDVPLTDSDPFDVNCSYRAAMDPSWKAMYPWASVPGQDTFLNAQGVVAGAGPHVSRLILIAHMGQVTLILANEKTHMRDANGNLSPHIVTKITRSCPKLSF